MIRLTRSLGFIAAVLLAGPVLGQIQISLRSNTSVQSNQVVLGDIADISGNPLEMRSKLARLDVGVLRPNSDRLTIRQSLVGIRLRLAGWSAEEFIVTGADQAVVTRRRPEPLTDVAIESAAKLTMQGTLNVGPEEVRVLLASPFMGAVPRSLQQDDSLSVKVLPPLSARAGSLSLTVQIWRDSRLVYSRSGRFDVLRRQQVVVTRTSLPHDHTITERDVHAETRFLASPVDQLDPSQVVGRRVRSAVAAGEIVEVRDLRPAGRTDRDQLVKVRDNVQVTAVNGRLKVKLTSAQALQSGRHGDTIRVRNLRSNEVLTGRVTSAGHVEIRL